MDPDLILIFMFVIIITTVIGITVNSVVQKVLDYKREKRGISDAQSATPQVHATTERQQMIEDRLQVLERLATDRGTLLADEIEALRDDRKARENG